MILRKNHSKRWHGVGGVVRQRGERARERENTVG